MCTPFTKKSNPSLKKSNSLSNKTSKTIFESPDNYFTPPHHSIHTPLTSGEQIKIEILVERLNNKLQQLGIKKLEAVNYSEEQVTHIHEILTSLIFTHIDLRDQHVKLRQTQSYFKRRSTKYQIKLAEEQKQHNQFQAQIRVLQTELMQQNLDYQNTIRMLESTIKSVQQANQLLQGKLNSFLKDEEMKRIFESFSDYLETIKEQQKQKDIQKEIIVTNQMNEQEKSKRKQSQNHIQQKYNLQNQNKELRQKLSKIQIQVNRWFQLKWKDSKPVSFCDNDEQFDYSIFQLSHKFQLSISQQPLAQQPKLSFPQFDLQKYEEYNILKKHNHCLAKICQKSYWLFNKLLPDCIEDGTKIIEIQQKVQQINQANDKFDDTMRYLDKVNKKLEQNNQLLSEYNIAQERKVLASFNFEEVILSLNEKFAQVNTITNVNCALMNLEIYKT